MVLFGLPEHGGMNIPDTQTLQDQVQLEYILKQLRWGKVVANDLLTTLDCVQMRSGLVTPLLEVTQPAIEYFENSHDLSIRKRLDKIGGSMWIEDCWTPKL